MKEYHPMSACGFTGHRDIPANRIEYVKRELRREIELAFSSGCTEFISGFADGADLEFAAIVANLKRTHAEVTLTAAIPYEGRLKTRNGLFQSLIKCCDNVHVSSSVYRRDCYALRNRYIVDNSTRLIAVFDGREKSGTAQTIRMAQAKGMELRIISIK